MPADSLTTWGGSLHLSFRILPEPSSHLKPFLESDGSTPDQVLERLPYDRARSGDPGSSGPDPKRYRDGKQLYQTAGLLYETEGRLRVTELGQATLRWVEIINSKNAGILGRHAAYGLAACQLRNPTGAGKRYDESMFVFPFLFIWRAMLALDWKISSEELNRALFKVRDEATLDHAIETIARSRKAGDQAIMGDETLTGRSKNDRIIPWISIASFGWTLISDKSGAGDSGYYEIPEVTRPVLKEAAAVRHRYREFPSVETYVEHVSFCAALPPDLR